MFDYESALSYIHFLESKGSDFSLDGVIKLLDELGNPQDKLNIIHIAGTNGKGSTISYIDSILHKANYRVGVFTSPAVFSYNEKYRLSGTNISNADFAKYFNIVYPCVQKLNNIGIFPSAFMVEVAIAYTYFYYENVDFALIECGLGGKNDATNIEKHNLCSVITEISLDHTKILGDTIQEIATEKCGIIRDNSAVITTRANSEVMPIIKNTADKLNTKLLVADIATADIVVQKKLADSIANTKNTDNNDCFYKGNIPATNKCKNTNCTKTIKTNSQNCDYAGCTQSINKNNQIYDYADYAKTADVKQHCDYTDYTQSISEDNQKFDCSNKQICEYADCTKTIKTNKQNSDYNNFSQVIRLNNRTFTTSMLGEYQKVNLPIALQVIEYLNSLGYTISPEDIDHGIQRAMWHGRFEVICTSPLFIIDGAHNPNASEYLKAFIEQYSANYDITLLVGIFADKNYEKIVANTTPLIKKVYTFDWDNPRSLGGEKLKETILKYNKNVEYISNLHTAIDTALKTATEHSLILAFGSLSHLSEIKKYINIIKNNNIEI